MKSGLIYQGTCHLDQTNPIVIGHLFVDLPRTPKQVGIPGYPEIAIFATIYSKAFSCISLQEEKLIVAVFTVVFF